MNDRRRAMLGVTQMALMAVTFTGCQRQIPPREPLPIVAPTTRPTGETLALGGPRADPMYRELLAVDLPIVVHVATVQNLDIRQARLAVQAAEGQHERSYGAIFPVIAPGLTFEGVRGNVRAVNGPLLGADFTSFFPAVLLQWALNPGRLYNDIVASRKRLDASEHQERSVVQNTLRAAVVGYYDLVLAQAKLSVARRTVAESEELLRITRLRVGAGAGLEADLRRSEADLARRKQDSAIALNTFYRSSISLAVTLHLDASITLVPLPQEVPQTTLVADHLGIETLLGLALAWREDLASVRTLVDAAAADRNAAAWGALGPQVQVGYTYGQLSSDTADANFSLREQQRLNANVGWALSLTALGDVKTADAVSKQAAVEAERRMDFVRAEVVRATQESSTSRQLIPMAKEQVEATEAALNLAQANLRAGTMLTLDVLQAEDAVDEARLRYADSVVRYNRSQVELLAALGLIDERALLGHQSESVPPQTMPHE